VAYLINYFSISISLALNSHPASGKNKSVNLPMSACLSIQIYNPTISDIQEIKFFEAEEWNTDSEKDLLIRAQELLAAVRSLGKSFEIKVCIEVTNIPMTLFLLNKKNSAHIEINNQKLSIREIQVLGLIMQGLTNNEIAEKLFISFETVRSHRKNILEKTGAKNTAALINHYHQTFFEK
jgi:DNA-binding CsgD family transcriptional regulator